MGLLFSHENVSGRHVTNAETMCHIICPALLVSRYYTSLYFSFLVEVPVISTPLLGPVVQAHTHERHARSLDSLIVYFVSPAVHKYYFRIPKL